MSLRRCLHLLHRSVKPFPRVTSQVSFSSSSILASMSSQAATSGGIDPAISPMLKSRKAILFDCDGVLWRGGRALPGAKELVEALRNAGIRVLFVTNNSTKSRVEYLHKIEKVLGIQADAEDVFCSAYAVAALVKEVAPDTKKAYVVGEGGIYQELESVGIEALGKDDERPFDFANFHPETDLDPEVNLVVTGFDSHFCYNKLALACSYLRYNKNCVFIATNTDATFPSPNATLPGGGSVVASLTKAIGRPYDYLAGKPSETLFHLVSKYTGIHANKDELLMVGDRLDTDISWGTHNGFATMLVMTGVTSAEELEDVKQKNDTEHIPTYVLPSVQEMLSEFQK